MLRVRILAALLLLATPVSGAFAGAWLQPEGRGQYILQGSYYTSDQFFDRDGTRQDQLRFNKYEFQPYLEYGLFKNLTVGATGYLQHVSQAGGSNNGLADPEFFARTELWGDTSQHLSLQPLVKLRSRFESDGNPRGGSRSTDAELSLLYGRSGLDLLSPNDYLDLRAGYRYRANSLHDQFKLDAALGLQLAPGWTVIPALRGILATKISDSAAFSENGDQDYDLIKAEIGLQYRLNDAQTVGLTGFDHVYGTQTGSGMGVIVSYMQGF